LRLGLEEIRLNTFSVKRPFGQVYKIHGAHKAKALTNQPSSQFLDIAFIS